MWLRYLSTLAIACAMYWACLSFAFPGYFAPFVPHHSDMYIPVGLLNRTASEVVLFPRPLANLFLRGIGAFGVEGSIAAVVLLLLTGLVLHVKSFANVSLLGPVLFCILLFAHPQFYFQHRHDVPAALSFILLIAVIECARRWIRSGSIHYLFLSFIATLAMGLTKETYYVSAIVLVFGLPLLSDGFHRGRWLGAMTGIVSIELLCLAYNSLRYKHYLGEATVAGASYSPSLHPGTLLPTLFVYLKELASVPLLALLACAFFVIRSDRRQLEVALLFVLAGIGALLPNSALPNHIEAHYAWVAAPLVFVPVLFVPVRSVGVWASLAVLTGVWLWSNRSQYASEPQRWLVRQEQGNARILSALPAIRQEAKEKTLVSGLKLSYHPWLSTDFIVQYFGPSSHWTFIGPHSQSGSGTVVRTSAAHAEQGTYDSAVLFQADGTLDRIVQRPGLVTDEILAPALTPYLQKLRSNPNDFAALLGAGVEYVESGWPQRAFSYLERANAVDKANPYPDFFLGRAAEMNGDPALARTHYLEAIAKDAVPPNPAFREALLKVSR